MALIKSISGIRGTIGGKTGTNLTPLDVVKFTAAYGSWLLEEGKGTKVVVGRNIERDSSFAQQSVSFGDNRVEWIGSLSNLDDVDVPQQYEGRLIQSKYILVDNNAKSDLDTAINTFKLCMDSKGTIGATFDDAYADCKSDFDTERTNIIKDRLNDGVQALD